MRSRNLVIEGAVIVLSILLAFGIDALWEERREASNTRQSLEVVRRDLVEVLKQLEELEKFSADTARASLEAARALSVLKPVAVADRPQVEAHILPTSSQTRRSKTQSFHQAFSCHCQGTMSRQNCRRAGT